MKINIAIVLFVLNVFVLNAQIDGSQKPLVIDESNSINTSNYKLPLKSSTPKSNFNLYEPPEDMERLRRNEKPFSMDDKKELLSPDNKDFVPKYFKDGLEKELKDEYAKDKYYGEFASSSEFANLYFRDHGAVDYDVIRILVNGDVIQNQVVLTGSYKGIKVRLTEGSNKIEIQALNEGEASPNTAQFKVYDDQNNLLVSNEWNLLTGVKASFTIIKK